MEEGKKEEDDGFYREYLNVAAAWKRSVAVLKSDPSQNETPKRVKTQQIPHRVYYRKSI